MVMLIVTAGYSYAQFRDVYQFSIDGYALGIDVFLYAMTH